MSKNKLILALLLCSATASAEGLPTYRFAQEIPIGGEGGWDYVSIDQEAHRLYLCQATRVVVVDLEKNKIAGEITDTPGVHGVAIAPELHRGFVSNGKEGKVSIVDLESLKTIAKVTVGENPDAIVYEPTSREVYVFNGRSKSATVIGAKSGKVVAKIELAGKPEFAAVDPVAHRVFVNLEDKNQVTAIDSKAHKVVASWSIAPGDEPSGMAIDLKNHRLFVGCGNERLLMLDSGSGKIIARVAIGKGVDANAFDPATQLVFSSNREGTVTVAHEDSAESLSVVQTLKTEFGSKTMALDSKTHRIYLPAAKFETPGGETHARPKVVSGSLRLLIYDLK